jgi:hypothetical protein
VCEQQRCVPAAVWNHCYRVSRTHTEGGSHTHTKHPRLLPILILITPSLFIRQPVVITLDLLQTIYNFCVAFHNLLHCLLPRTSLLVECNDTSGPLVYNRAAMCIKCMKVSQMSPFIVHYFWPEPYLPWSKVVHYIVNKGPFETWLMWWFSCNSGTEEEEVMRANDQLQRLRLGVFNRPGWSSPQTVIGPRLTVHFIYKRWFS